MIVVKFIVNFDNPLYGLFEDIMNNSEWTDHDHVKFEALDTGSKKHQRKARGYFSKYASSEVFVVIEDDEKEGEKVLDVIYKEQANKPGHSWYSILEDKLTNILNENQ